MEHKDEVKIYYIMSINVVAYLRSHNIEPVCEPEVTEDGKAKYHFVDNDKFRKILTKYNNDEFIQKFVGMHRQTKLEMQRIKRSKY